MLTAAFVPLVPLVVVDVVAVRDVVVVRDCPVVVIVGYEAGAVVRGGGNC